MGLPAPQPTSTYLSDFFQFEYTGHTSAVGGQQTYTEGYQVTFDVYVGASKGGSLSVDLVVNVIVTDDPTVTPPAIGDLWTTPSR